MSSAYWIGVALLGGAGAIARVELGALVTARLRSVWSGTLAVNLLGAFALGLVTGLQPSDGLRRLVALGFLGAFTTFSTWMVEADRAHPRSRLLLLAGALALGLGAVWLGRELGTAL